MAARARSDDPDYLARHATADVFRLGDNVVIGANCVLVGPIEICDNVIIGTMSLVNRSISQPGTYVGIPVRRISPDPQTLREIASIQVMRSFPTHGALRESQNWRRDFGDARSLHYIMYLSEVRAPEHGPLTFLGKPASGRVRGSIVIRRLTDEQIAAETGTTDCEIFCGGPGDAIFVDPAACYHYGSRCAVPRGARGAQAAARSAGRLYRPCAAALSGRAHTLNGVPG